MGRNAILVVSALIFLRVSTVQQRGDCPQCNQELAHFFQGDENCTRQKRDPREIIERAIQAHGGKENLLRSTRTSTKTRGCIFQKGMSINYMAQSSEELPTRLRAELNLEGATPSPRTIIVVNGNLGWEKAGEKEAVALDENGLADATTGLYERYALCLFPLLEERTYTLTTVAEVKTKERSLIGVSVSATGKRPLQLYFDKATGLIAKRVTINTVSGLVHEEHLLDYKDFGGLLYPTRWVAYDGKEKIRELRIIDIDFVAQERPALFKKP
jgi:hypothetical protein